VLGADGAGLRVAAAGVMRVFPGRLCEGGPVLLVGRGWWCGRCAVIVRYRDICWCRSVRNLSVGVVFLGLAVCPLPVGTDLGQCLCAGIRCSVACGVWVSGPITASV